MLRVMRILVWLALAISVVLAFFSRLIILTLFGPAYAPAASVLAIHTWIFALVTLNCCGNQWLLDKGYFHCNMYQTLVGAVVNIGLNLFLIPKLGIVGAAIASFAGQFASVMLMMAVLPKTRPLFRLQLASLAPVDVNGLSVCAAGNRADRAPGIRRNG